MLDNWPLMGYASCLHYEEGMFGVDGSSHHPLRKQHTGLPRKDRKIPPEHFYTVIPRLVDLCRGSSLFPFQCFLLLL